MSDPICCVDVYLDSATGYKIYQLLNDYDNQHGTIITYEDYFKPLGVKLKALYDDNIKEVGYTLIFPSETAKVEFLLQWL